MHPQNNGTMKMHTENLAKQNHFYTHFSILYNLMMHWNFKELSHLRMYTIMGIIKDACKMLLIMLKLSSNFAIFLILNEDK